jgi:hypothetical protein
MDEITYQPLYTIEAATPIVGTRTKVYVLLQRRVLEGLKSGRRTMVTGASLKRYIESLPKATFRPSRAAEADRAEAA